MDRTQPHLQLQPDATDWEWRSRWLPYLIALAVVALTTAANLIVLPYIGYRAVALVYLFVVSTLGLFAGRGPVLAAAAASAIVWNFAFIPPRFTMQIHSVEDALMFGMYFILALITGTLTSRLRAQEKAERQREARTAALYALAREVSNAVTMADVLRTAAKQIGQAFNADVAFLLDQPNGQLADLPHPASTLALTNEEPGDDFQFLPLVAPSGRVGMMGVRTRKIQRRTTEQQNLLETFAGQIALAIERERLDEAAEHAQVLAESERLYKTLLNSVSHELRTPIAAIASAASGLLDSKIGDSLDARISLAREIQDASDRLDRVVENLLNMTRLESGRLKPNRVWCDVSDLIGVVVRRVKGDLARHELAVDAAQDLPLVRMDFVLMEQALTNLLHNAAMHTPPGTRISVAAKIDGADLILSVADQGPGLPPGDLGRVFEKFYRAPGAAPGGTGLGLSITKGLVEAQGGAITVENGAAGGANFIIRLPVSEPPIVPQERTE